MTNQKSASDKTAVLSQDTSDPLSILRQSPSLGSLSDTILTALAKLMQPLRCGKGQVIIKQGEPVQNLCVVVSGAFEVRLRTESDAVVPIASLKAGDCVGEMGLLTGENASADVVALGPAEALALGRDDFEQLITDHPGILRQFVRLLAHRLRKTNAAVGVARELGDRLTHFIIEEEAGSGPVIIGKHPKVSAAKAAAAKMAQHDSPVFIHGEAGTGKESFARLIHSNSERKSGPLLCIDCRQITESPWGDRFFGSYHREGGKADRHVVVCYKDMADGGTVLLNDIDQLPKAVQERMAAFLSESPAHGRSLRIIAISESNLESMVRTGLLLPDLAKHFADNLLEVPALRDHKRDIPELAAAFLKAPAAKLGKGLTGFSARAHAKLVSHDFRYANVRELKEAIQRSAILAEGDTVEAEQIFLGVPAPSRKVGINLLSPALKKWSLPVMRLTRYARLIASAVFLFILYQCFFGPGWAGTDLSTILVWAVWWPSLIISLIVMGRLWCAVCPMALMGETAQRLKSLNKRIPDWLEKHGRTIAAVGFFVIMFTEEVSGMRHSPALTGVLLLSIISGAVITGIVFPRRTWCRHLCPLGGFAGLCSHSSLLEVRPTFDICSAKCTGHMCYKGDAQTPGCPMHSHLMFVNTNHDCVMCLNCVTLCPNGSPQINFRPPTQELTELAPPEMGDGLNVAMLSGMLVSLLLLQAAEHGAPGRVRDLLEANRFAAVAAVMVAGAALPTLLVWRLLLSRKFTLHKELSARFLKLFMASAPLVVAGFAAYQIGWVPGLDPDGTALTLRLEMGVWALPPVPLLFLGRMFLIAVGFGITCTIFGRLYRFWSPINLRWQKTLFATQIGLSAAYAGFLVLLCAGVI